MGFDLVVVGLGAEVESLFRCNDSVVGGLEIENGENV